VEDGVSGLLVAERDDAALTQAMRRLAEDPELFAPSVPPLRIGPGRNLIFGCKPRVLEGHYAEVIGGLHSLKLDGARPWAFLAKPGRYGRALKSSSVPKLRQLAIEQNLKLGHFFLGWAVPWLGRHKSKPSIIIHVPLGGLPIAESRLPAHHRSRTGYLIHPYRHLAGNRRQRRFSTRGSPKSPGPPSAAPPDGSALGFGASGITVSFGSA